MLAFTIPHPTLLIDGGDLFPVRRVYCIGRNYADHAREMGGDPQREPPFFFQKPGDAVQPVGPEGDTDHPYPPLTNDYQPEIELVACLHRGGHDIAPADALECVFGYAVGLDMTRRDRQAAMKDGRRPWEIGKSFDRSAPIGPIRPVARGGHLTRGAISLAVNGATRQRADLADMIWSVAEQIGELSRGTTLAPGDVIMAGTPAGVGPVKRGDRLDGRIEGLPPLRLRIV